MNSAQPSLQGLDVDVHVVNAHTIHARLRRWKNRLALSVMAAMVFISLIPLFSVLFTLISKGIGSLSLDFFTKLPAVIGERGGLANAVVGSVVLLGVASLIAVPTGLLVGMFLWHNRDSKLSSISRLLLDVMTGIPAVVIGVFMYTICFGKQSVLAGGASLAMIMLPIFARTTEQALASIPATVHEAGLALGIARRKVVLRIILRSSMPAVLTGLFLAVARVGGEAAPLLFTSYGDNNWPSHSVSDLARLQPIVNESIKSLPIALYEYSDSAFPEQRNLAWAAALVLVCMILAVRLMTRVYTRIRYGSGGALTV